MKHIVCKLSLLIVCLCFVCMANGEAYKGKMATRPRAKADLERCRRAQGSAELSINNVRARINQGGNMWYDGSTARYFVPKNGNSTAMFCAALWIGGQDENLQLRVAALRFGSEGEDFWPGPLTVDGKASINKSVCDEWDKLYRITKAEVKNFISSFQTDAEGKPIPGTYDPATLTDAIKNWPGNGNTSKNQSRFLAPFYDQNKDGKYNYADGDYPYYDFDGKLCPQTIKNNLPAGSSYTPTPTMESDTTSPNYGTGGTIKAYGGLLVDQVLKGDETLWWIFNDKGNSHTESGSENPIGLEIRAQAFAFTMNDEINNMTFYSYEIINRSTFTLTNTYFSQWVDPDLGYAQDDFVGCDVERGLGYCYNGKATDGPGTGAYSGNPPAIGIDFFQGPYMDPDGRDNPKIDTNAFIDNYGAAALNQYRDANGKINPILLTDNAEKYKLAWYPKSKDSIDACAINGVNFGNGIIDDERFGMRRFVYYNNSTYDNGEPSKASDYYNYLRGLWKNGVHMKYGGNGYNGGTGFLKDYDADFMFPGTSDIWGWGTRNGGHEDIGKGNEWSENTASNSAGDRRFMQSAGPFTLKPGAINYITVGIPFAQATTGGPTASVELLRKVDDKCQALFDECFNPLPTPSAPNLTVQELDRQIILYLDNVTGNNINESFKALDPSIAKDSVNGHLPDRYYKFEGYQIFQLKDANVSVAEIYDNSKARLVAQCDIENYDADQNNQAIATLTNYTTNSTGQLSSQVMVEGANKGIQHTFKVTEDKFATTADTRIVNNKKYYYIAIAYAYNNFKPFSPTDATKVDGQKEPYLASDKAGDGSSIEPVVAIPHKVESEHNGTLVQSYYGESPEIMRIEGNGNGGMILNFKSSTMEALMGQTNQYPTDENGNQLNTLDGQYTKNLIEKPEYQTNYGPLNIKVVDPLSIKPGSYRIKLEPKEGFENVFDSCYWVITNIDTTKPVYSGTTQKEIRSKRPIGDINEQIIFDLGISISLSNPANVANSIDYNKTEAAGGDLISGSLLSSSLTYKNSASTWLFGYPDADGSATTNWIRSGSSMPSGENDASTDTLSDYYYKGTSSAGASVNIPIDPKGEYEGCLNGTWAPYRFASISAQHPGFSSGYLRNSSEPYDKGLFNTLKIPSLIYNNLNNLASVDIVFTSDTTKWTRCPVIEMGTHSAITEGGAKKFTLRKHASVYCNGQSMTNGDMGMGWFPGYAVNLETGERLNMMFGENSELGEFNGRDMMWNPASYGTDYGQETFGGMHYVYVLGTSSFKINNVNAETQTIKPTRYDKGVWAKGLLETLSSATGVSAENLDQLAAGHALYASVMWVGMPAPITNLFEQGVNVAIAKKNPMLIPTDAIVKLRVRKPYQLYWSGAAAANNPVSPTTPENSNYPMYQFTIENNLATVIGDKEVAKTALDNITVVPNPYFAANLYETDQIQNMVKITNLPPDCYITIYAVDGTVVRKLRGPSATLVSGGGTPLTSIDWDLKNERGLQISGGVYLIHIKADGVGEKLIKWFGALRPVDLNSFQ